MSVLFQDVGQFEAGPEGWSVDQLLQLLGHPGVLLQLAACLFDHVQVEFLNGLLLVAQL